MTVLDELRNLSSAEEFFEYLDVAYDPAVLRVCRLHVLRRMGEMLAGDALLGVEESAIRVRCRSHLATAYAELSFRGPLEARVFKVLKDASRVRTRTLIPLVPLGRRTD